MNWLHPHSPPIPHNAIPLPLRLALGRAEVLHLWESLWDRGVATGQSIGLAEGIVGASLVWLALILTWMILDRTRRGQP